MNYHKKVKCYGKLFEKMDEISEELGSDEPITSERLDILSDMVEVAGVIGDYLNGNSKPMKELVERHRKALT